VAAKKHQITDAERAKRIREAAKEHETSNDPADFEWAFSRIVKDGKAAGRLPKERRRSEA